MDKSGIGRTGVAREMRPRKRRQFVSARELAEALADIPAIDYEQLRADIDAVVDQDPTPRYWVDQQPRTG
jgi:hypothetical protein